MVPPFRDARRSSRASARTLRVGAVALSVVAATIVAPGTGPGDARSASTVASSPLAARLASLLQSPVFHRHQTGLAVVALPEGRTVFEKNAERLLRPASTQKILTSVAALALLGPEFRFETGMYADARLDTSGTIAGNLYLRGTGAPDLVGEAWWLIVRRLAGLGLRRVEGDLIGDESFFDTIRRPPGWPDSKNDSSYSAPIGALSCNFNAVSVHIEPPIDLDHPPQLTAEPASSFFRIVNRATASTRSTSISVDRLYRDGQNFLVVNGRVRLGGDPITIYRSVENPAMYALHVFHEIARAEGIAIDGDLRIGRVPDGASEIYQHVSRPLGDLVRDMNKHSNNFMAESLVKTLGARLVGIPGTTTNGMSVIRNYLEGRGLDTGRAILADGSGLSSQNRLSARFIATLLTQAAADFEIGPELVSSLPIGGADGTLEERFGGELAGRRVRAKTGRVARARTLAGYVANTEGRLFAFALLSDKARGSLEAIHRALDRVVDAIAKSTDAELAALPDEPEAPSPQE
jgi:D-alanyl-D-alanine carboxypeptidase/D-alanyl-D-alanine-endopeptidase (penicillin-binding protein 4)